MKTLIPILEQAVINAAISNHSPLQSKNKTGIGLLSLSVFFCGAAIIFGFIAGYGWLLVQFTQPVAAVIAAAFVLGLSILFALCGLYLLKKPQPLVHQAETPDLMELISDVACEDVMDAIHDNPKTTMLLAAAAGLIAGKRL